MSNLPFDPKNQFFSFEIFPPKNREGEEILEKNLHKLKKFNPAFISVTMGAMGSNARNTFSIVEKIESIGLNGVAHLTCVNASRSKMKELLTELQKTEIKHLLCLRGDPPQGSSKFTPPEDGFHYAEELVRFVRQETGDFFSIGVAGYPEGHVESDTPENDWKHLIQKVNEGADYILTQLFFENQDYWNFTNFLRNQNIEIPVIPGLMPVTNFSQLTKLTEMCGAKIPPKMNSRLEALQSDLTATREYGIEYTTHQAKELLKKNVPGVHFYILNQTESVEKILGSCSS